MVKLSSKVNTQSYIDITPYTVPKVGAAVLSDSPVTLIYGWRDGGKSTSAFNTLIWQCLLEPHFRAAHCREKYNEIAGSTFQTLKDCIINMGLSDYFLIRNDRYRIINKARPSNFFFGASADQPDKIRSTADTTHIIVDEFHNSSAKDFESLYGTTRAKPGQKIKFIAIFNNDKISTSNWINQTFFLKESPMYNEVERVLVSYEDNPFIDKERTEKKLKLICLNDNAKFEALKAGHFVIEENKNPFFYAYDKAKHTTNEPIPFDRQFPVLLAFDFNISPATCVVAQSVPGSFCYILKAYKERNTTVDDLCKRILSDFPGAVFRVTGDPAGKARNAGYNSPNETMYSIIKRALNIGIGQIDQPNINYAGENYWRELRIFCNAILQNHPNFFIHHIQGAELINDLQIATTEEGKDKLYKTSGDTEFGMHLADCFVYLLTTYFNDYVKRFSQ